MSITTINRQQKISLAKIGKKYKTPHILNVAKVQINGSQFRTAHLKYSIDSNMKLFISHASEDKDEIARPLAQHLIDKGFQVWYDEYSLKVGDSLSDEIEKGLIDCDYGIVILSKNFFNKDWPKKELSGLVSKEIGFGKKSILPVWHNITYQEILNFSVTLADRFAVSTEKDLSQIVEAIDKAIGLRNYDRKALDQEARKVASYFYKMHFSAHRGVVRWCPNIVAVFGNDGYKSDDGTPTDAFIRIEKFRFELQKLGIKELSFNTHEDGYSWAMLIETTESKRIFELLWSCGNTNQVQKTKAATTFNLEEVINENCSHLKI